MKNHNDEWEEEEMNNDAVSVKICGDGACMELTKAVCALLVREPQRSLNEAVEDVCRIYRYVRKQAGLSS